MSGGFTLLELLVTIAILAILGGFLLFNTQAPAKFQLQNEAQKLAANIRLIQEKALSSEEFQGSAPPGWGVYFNQASNNYYILFADLNGDGQYNGANESFNKVYFSSPVRLGSLNSSQAAVVYQPPRPAVNFWPAGLSQINLTLELKNNPSETQLITITQNGTVDIQ